MDTKQLPAFTVQKESPKTIWQRAKSRIFTKQNLNKGALVAAVATTGSLANAADTYDITSVVTNLGLAVSAASAIGVAWLGFSAGIAIWRNLRSAAK